METREEVISKFYKAIKWTSVLLFVLVIAFALNKCNNSEPRVAKTIPVKIITEEIKGEFKQEKPNHTVIFEQPKELLKDSETTEVNLEVQKLILENKNLVKNYQKQNDSLKQKLYEKAIQANSFSSQFEDDNIKIDINGVVQGEVKSIKPSYTIKPKTITVDVPVKESVFTLKAGAEYGNTMLFDKGVFKGNLEFENKKGNSYNIGYDTDQRIWLGAKFTVFSISR